MTRSGERYHVTVVGVSSSKKRFVYRPIRWTPGMGGMSAGGVFGVIVLVLLGICCCGYRGAVATGRTKNRHGWMVDAVRDRLPDELPLPSLASLRSRLPTAGRGGYTRRRNDSASGDGGGPRRRRRADARVGVHGAAHRAVAGVCRRSPRAPPPPTSARRRCRSTRAA